MWIEPPSCQRRVALADVQVNISINVSPIAVDGVFAVESLVFL
jgi:hypothetical protein